MKIKHLIILCLLAITFTSCHHDDETPVGMRTVLVYIMGENSLSPYASSNMDDMVAGADKIPTNCNLIVYVDDVELPRIYKITAGGKQLVKSFTAEKNSADAATLKEIMSYTMAHYPANTYGLVLWSHASAWCPANSKQRTIGIDNQSNSYSNTGSEMEIADLATALATFPKLDFIFSDACSMQSIEVAYELKDVTQYVAGSPAEIPGPGAPYSKIVGDMFAQTPAACMSTLVNDYYEHYKGSWGILLSAVQCDQLDNLADATARALPTFISGKSEVYTDTLQAYSIFSSISYWRPEFFDMNDVMRANLSNTDYTKWKTVFDKAVPYKACTATWTSAFSSHGFSPTLRDTTRYGGVSMYVPGSKYESHGLNTAFRKMKWYTAAGWPSTGW